MDDDFDEFGNFVGQEYSESNSELEEEWNDDVEIIENDQDEQNVSEPSVKGRFNNTSPNVAIVDQPSNWDFVCGLRSIVTLNRYFAIVGLTNHGKTSLFNLLVSESPVVIAKERRSLTMTSRYASVVHQDYSGKSFLLNAVDTPGHEDFVIERMLGEQSADGNVLVIDCVEGTSQSRIVHGTPDLIVINKIDRLMLELKLRPREAYERLDYLITQDLQADWESVVFMSTKFKFSFTLESIAQLYRKYQNASNFTIVSAMVETYILEPIFKLIAYGLIGQSAQGHLKAIGICLSDEDWGMPSTDRISSIMSLYLEHPLRPLVHAIVEHIPVRKKTRNVQYFKNIDNKLISGRAGFEGITISGALVVHVANAVPTTYVPPFAWFYSPYNHNVSMDEVADAAKYRVLTVSVETLETSRPKRESLEMQLMRLPSQFPGISVHSSEAGYYVLYGTGELYFDTALKYSKTYYKVSQPVALLRETISSESQVHFPTKSADLSVSLRVSAEPSNQDPEDSDEAVLWKSFSHSCCIYGPVICDQQIKKDIIKGIESCIKSGPLIESQVVGVRFRISELTNDNSFHWFSTARRGACAAILMASPRLLEPEVIISVTGKLAAGKAVYSEVSRRSGEVTSDEPIYGTNLYRTECKIPLMDSLALPLDILCQMDQRNDATVYKQFSSWIEVTGDPLDSRQIVKRMQPSEPRERARDFMSKIRRFKGLNPEPELGKYVDPRVMKLLMI